ncbi:MAG: hypothetical protein LBJ01_06950 [Tannerella sp.]|jgi:hypothetical protein|nr:hypothetical protein [Tannerella sp.]
MGKILKIYKVSDAYTHLCMPIQVGNGREVSVEFKGTHKTYVTDDAKLQGQIEDTALFKDGTIYLSEEFDDSEPLPEDVPPKDAAVYAAISSFQEAKEILAKDYGVPVKRMINPRSIIKAAKELNLLFPELERMLESSGNKP